MPMRAWLVRAVPAVTAVAVTLAAAAATLMSAVHEAAPERPGTATLDNVIFAPPLEQATPQPVACRECATKTPTPKSL